MKKYLLFALLATSAVVGCKKPIEEPMGYFKLEHVSGDAQYESPASLKFNGENIEIGGPTFPRPYYIEKNIIHIFNSSDNYLPYMKILKNEGSELLLHPMHEQNVELTYQKQS